MPASQIDPVIRIERSGAGATRHAAIRHTPTTRGIFLYLVKIELTPFRLRIPTNSSGYSDAKSTTYSDTKSAMDSDLMSATCDVVP